jgi:hypothetical protein
MRVLSENALNLRILYSQIMNKPLFNVYNEACLSTTLSLEFIITAFIGTGTQALLNIPLGDYLVFM